MVVLCSGALVSTSCATVDSTAEVSAPSAEYGANLASSTTTSSPASSRSATGSGDLTTGSSGESIGEPSVSDLLAGLEGLTVEQLVAATGLSADELASLGVTPDAVGALAATLHRVAGGAAAGSPPDAVAALLAGAGTSLLTPAGELTSEARSLLAGIDPATFAALVGTAMTVPESVTDTLGTILAVVDPNGLGQFQEDRSALSVAAVVLAAAIGRDPVELGKLAVAGEIDPRFAEVTGFILDLTTRVTPQLIDRINNLVGILGPYTLEALAGAFALLEDPEVGALLEEAFANPLTVVVSFGSAVMAIPGLAQLVAPGTFDDPRATYGAILGLAVLAILNSGATGLEDFLRGLGIQAQG